LLHFTVGSLSIAGGVILLVLAVVMVLGQPGGDHATEGKDPMQLAQVPLAVPYLLNPVGIVGLVTVSAEAKSVSVLAVEVGMLCFVLVLDVAVFRWADAVSAKLDENRMLVTEKVFGFRLRVFECGKIHLVRLRLAWPRWARCSYPGAPRRRREVRHDRCRGHAGQAPQTAQ
jgi:small neutral amino acid transporter SnatA (MarC family)